VAPQSKFFEYRFRLAAAVILAGLTASHELDVSLLLAAIVLVFVASLISATRRVLWLTLLFSFWYFVFAVLVGCALNYNSGQSAEIAVIPQVTAITLRLIVVGVDFQLCFAPVIPNGEMIPMLRAIWLSPRMIAIFSGGFTMIGELTLRLSQVLDARQAQGVGPPSRWRALRELPSLTAPVFIAAVDSAIARSDLWAERNLLPKLLSFEPETRASWKKVTLSALLLCGGILSVSRIWRYLQ